MEIKDVFSMENEFENGLVKKRHGSSNICGHPIVIGRGVLEAAVATTFATTITMISKLCSPFHLVKKH